MQPIDYLIAATVVAVRRRSAVGALPQSRNDLRELIERTFSVKLPDDAFNKLVVSLRTNRLLSIIDDEYAGEIFTVSRTRMDKPSGDFAQILVKSDWGGNGLLSRVFANQKYWRDLTKREENEVELALEQEPVGATLLTDRVVTLTHNQAVEIEEKTSEIISQVSLLNFIEGEPNLRELVLGQLKAGRELVQEGTFKIYAIEITLVEGLQFLAKRYEREGVAALAAALVIIVFKHIGVDA